MSVEPSMEEILSSIKRIIAEEGETPIRGRRAGRAAPPPLPVDEEETEVLELSHPLDDPLTDRPAPVLSRPFAAQQEAGVRPAPLPEPQPAPEIAPAPASPPPTAAEPRTPPPVVPPMPATDPADPILSPQAAIASRHALDSLSRLMVKPEAGGDNTLEGLVREMLRPMLRDWLDAHLPAMVETMVQAEIARITGEQR